MLSARAVAERRGEQGLRRRSVDRVGTLPHRQFPDRQPLDGGRGHRGRDSAVGVQRKVRAVLLHRAQRHNESDGTIGELGPAQSTQDRRGHHLVNSSDVNSMW